MSYLYPTKSVTIFKIQSKKITVIGEQHLINNYFYQKLNDTWLLWQWIFEQMKKDKALYERSLTVGPEDRSYTGKKDDLIDTSGRGRGGHWWNPFLNKTKKDFADLYEEHNLMDSLFPYTASCVAKAEETNNFTKPCQQCFWCLEKYWAYGMFDYPEAYNL